MMQDNYQSKQRYVDLLSDAGFKAVFGDERNSDVVIDFLNVVLESGIVAPQTIMLTFVQLRNFRLEAEQCQSSFDKWCYTCKNSGKLESKPEGFEDERMQRLYDACEIAQFDKDKQQNYLESIMLEADYLYDMRCAREEGEAKGRKQGKAEGMEAGLKQGLEKGISRGKAEGKAEIARNLKAMSMPVEQIVAATGLSVEQIIAL